MGYIIGIRVAAIMLAGGVFSWLVLMPAIYFFGSHLTGPLYPGTVPIAQMEPSRNVEDVCAADGCGCGGGGGIDHAAADAADDLSSALTQGFRKTGGRRSPRLRRRCARTSTICR